MKRILTSSSLCLFLCLFLLVPMITKAQRAPVAASVPGEFIVKYKSSTSSIHSQRSKLAMKADIHKAFTNMGMYHIAMKAGPGEAAQLQDIKNDPDVEFVEPNYIWNKSEVAAGNIALNTYTYNQVLHFNRANPDNDFYQNDLNTGVRESWTHSASLATNPHKVVVAIVDTGLDSSHTLFKPVDQGGSGALWINNAEATGRAGIDDDQNGYVDDISGWNFITNSPNFDDDDDHGTHVAGIIVGVAQNIFARPLQESKIQVMPLKFLGADGTGTTASAINAIYYAVNKGAQVINNSWGGPTYSRALHEALAFAYQQQVLIVTAAGNFHTDNDSVSMYPANYDVPSNIAVASSTSYDSLSDFSNFGQSLVHIASPGEGVLSSVPKDSYAYMDGTSMAAPFVSGMAAMALRENPSLTGFQVKQLIISSATALQSFNGVVSSGARVDSDNLVLQAKSTVGTLSSYQPQYKAQYRAPASDGAGGAAGCGLVKSAIHEGPGQNGPPPMAGVIGGLLLIPLMAWVVLRTRQANQQQSYKRRYERFRMNSEIRVKVGDRELVGAMNTISQGGLSFNTDQALEKGGIVTMRIASPDGQELIEVQGQVVWSEKNRAYGVQFADATNLGTLSMIQRWTRSLVKS